MASEMFEGPVAAVADPGIIVRYSVNLGEQDRIIQFEGAIDRDAALGEYNHLADKLRIVANRQKAIQVLPVYRRQLQAQEEKHTENKARTAAVAARIQSLKEARETRALELRREHGSRLDADRGEWVASGRRGDYRPQGHVKANLERLKAEIDQLAANQNKDDAEAQQQLSVLENEVKEGERACGQLKALIAEAEALARCEDVSGTAEG